MFSSSPAHSYTYCNSAMTMDPAASIYLHPSGVKSPFPLPLKSHWSLDVTRSLCKSPDSSALWVPRSRRSSSQFLRPQVSSITSVSADKIPLLHLKRRMGTFKGVLSGGAHVVVTTPHYSRATGPFHSTTLGWLYLLFPRSEKSSFRCFNDQFVQQWRTTLETCINKMANHPVFTAGDADHSSDRSSIIKRRWQMNGRFNGIHWLIHRWSSLRRDG